MIEVQEAVRVASEYIASLFPDARDLRLEEVEVDKKGAWDVTLSFLPKDADPSPATPGAAGPPWSNSSQPTTIGIDPRRTFKVVELDPKGHVRAVRIRPILVG